MGATVRIEIDKHTADMLQRRARELGVTVQELVAELAALDSGARDANASEIAELDRRYARATGSERVPHERVVQWLRTWGTSGFRPWPGQQIEWSLDALADLDRFAAFLHERFPDLAARVGREIVARADILARHPKLGRPMAGREEYREIVLQILGGAYVVLTRDVHGCGLRAGDIGTVAERHVVPGVAEDGYSVEFLDMTGNTVAVIAVTASALRLPTMGDRPAAWRV